MKECNGNEEDEQIWSGIKILLLLFLFIYFFFFFRFIFLMAYGTESMYYVTNTTIYNNISIYFFLCSYFFSPFLQTDVAHRQMIYNDINRRTVLFPNGDYGVTRVF